MIQDKNSNISESEKIIQIVDIGIHGEGIGKIPSGVTVFTHGALPGESVQITNIQVFSRFWKADLEKILLPSPKRISPKCKYYARCGGCQLQHTTYESQIEWKQEHVHSTLVKIGKLSTQIRPIIPAKPEWFYRNKGQFPVAYGEKKTPQIGFYSSGSHNLIDIEECPIQHPRINDVLAQIRSLLRQGVLSLYSESSYKGALRHVVLRYSYSLKKVWVILVCNEESQEGLSAWVSVLSKHPHIGGVLLNLNSRRGNSILGSVSKLLWGSSNLKDSISDTHFSFSATSFSQSHWPQTELLYKLVQTAAELTGTETVWDLFCGVGTIGLYLSQKVDNLIGIEFHDSAIEEAQKNASDLHISKASFIKFNLDNGVPFSLATPDVIILDPPRKGCSDLLIKELIKSNAKKIIYVSCNPSTLARDLGIMSIQGYNVQWVQPIDLFPQTVHVECVALLIKA